MLTRNIRRMIILNRYYKITRFYQFLSGIALKTFLLLALIAGAYLALSHYIDDAEMLFHTMTSKIPPFLMFSIFIVSEFFLGLIPPEFFLVWTSKSLTPWVHVFLYSTLSYSVGILAYYLGKKLHLISWVKNYIELKYTKHIHNLRKWGGMFIFVGAMLPVPYSLVSLASGLINYRIKNYMVWSLFRYLRFFIYAIVVFEIM